MFCCDGKDMKCLCDQLECKVNQTPKGIQIDISAKDPGKTEQFKALLKALNDFCECRWPEKAGEWAPLRRYRHLIFFRNLWYDIPTARASSSAARASVSKTESRGFKSFLARHSHQSPKSGYFFICGNVQPAFEDAVFLRICRTTGALASPAREHNAFYRGSFG